MNSALANHRQIGLLGGSFDPVHQGHLALAAAAQRCLALDEIWFIPVGHAWQKSRALSAAEHRLALLHLALEKQPSWHVEPCELQRVGATYTIDTLRLLQTRHPAYRFTWILGADQLDNFVTWHAWEAILQCCRLAVAPRLVSSEPLKPMQPIQPTQPTQPMRQAPAFSVRLKPTLTPPLGPVLQAWFDDHHLPVAQHIVALDMAPVSCAATRIRANLQAGRVDEPCLPPAVLHYLLKHSLY